MNTPAEGPSRFEYAVVPWRATDGGAVMLAQLNAMGAEGWEAVGLAPRTTEAPMGGMGASSVSELVVLMKRRANP